MRRLLSGEQVGADPHATAQTRKVYRDAGGRGDLLLQIHVSLDRCERELLPLLRERLCGAGERA